MSETAKNEMEIPAIQSPEDYLPENTKKEIDEALVAATRYAAALRVVDDDAMNAANAMCNGLAQRKKGIEQFRLAIVAPLKAHLAKIDAFFKGMGAKFDAPLEVMTLKVTSYREKKIAQQRAEAEKIEKDRQEKEAKLKAKLKAEADAAAAKGQEAEAERLRIKAEQTVVKAAEPKKTEPAKTTYTEGGGRTTFIKDADFRIANRDLVPDEFWTLDEKMIGARVRSLRSTLEVGKIYKDLIPGVIISCTERPSFSGDK